MMVLPQDMVFIGISRTRNVLEGMLLVVSIMRIIIVIRVVYGMQQEWVH